MSVFVCEWWGIKCFVSSIITEYLVKLLQYYPKRSFCVLAVEILYCTDFNDALFLEKNKTNPTNKINNKKNKKTTTTKDKRSPHKKDKNKTKNKKQKKPNRKLHHVTLVSIENLRGRMLRAIFHFSQYEH